MSDGHVSLCRKRGSLRLGPGDLTLWWGAEPLEAVAVVREGTPRATVLHLPPSLLPLHHSRLRELMARPLSSTSGVAALLACHMRDLVEHSATVRLAQLAWLKQAAVSLVAALLTGATEELREESSLRRETLLRIGKTHIELHLDDPSLSPTTIAAALHISVRYLHCVFQQDLMTVNRYVQTRRLERCRRDLADPEKEGLSVEVIRTRWGFQDATVFSRAFKKAYGTTPGEYRRRLRRRG
ncbi:MAG: helix-turn-helix domain-containing protein [Streptomyces sp.]|nr:helix-turn-helix domain-containing protein [Streptomyces sp.]